jgi:GAF domain-containing protein
VPVDHEAVVASLHTLLAAVDMPDPAGESVLSQRLEQVMTAAAQVLAVDGVGLMMLDEHDGLRAVGASDPVSAALEEGQLQVGQGPGVDCVRSGRTVAADDLADSACPALWEVLRGHGAGSAVSAEERVWAVRAVLSVPVRVREQVVGTLNALREEPTRWTTTDVRAIEAYAGIVAVLLRLSSQERRAFVRRVSQTGEG